MTFTISPAIKQCWPETALGLLLYRVQVAPQLPPAAGPVRPDRGQPGPAVYLGHHRQAPPIAATRQAYKALGASPTNTGTRRRPCSGGW